MNNAGATTTINTSEATTKAENNIVFTRPFLFTGLYYMRCTEVV